MVQLQLDEQFEGMSEATARLLARAIEEATGYSQIEAVRVPPKNEWHVLTVRGLPNGIYWAYNSQTGELSLGGTVRDEARAYAPGATFWSTEYLPTTTWLEIIHVRAGDGE